MIVSGVLWSSYSGVDTCMLSCGRVCGKLNFYLTGFLSQQLFALPCWPLCSAFHMKLEKQYPVFLHVLHKKHDVLKSVHATFINCNNSLLNSYKRVLLTSAMKVIDDRQSLILEKKKTLVKEITAMVVKWVWTHFCSEILLLKGTQDTAKKFIT